MDRRSSRSASWAVAPWLVVAAVSCTTEVDDGFGTFTGPGANSSPMGITTFEDSEGPDSAGTDGPATGGGSADGTSGGPGGTSTGADTGTTTAEDCDPPCPMDQICMLGVCEPVDDSTTGPPACHDVPGNYDSCLGPGGVVDISGCDDPGANCITVGTPALAGACAVDPCMDVCDCPFAPPTGNAPITCGPLTGGNDLCYLDCSAGQICPDGMICFAEQACIWPGDLADGTPYGDCHDGDISVCGLEGSCLSDGGMTAGVCTNDCVNAASCPPSPGGTAFVSCVDITEDGAPECILDCSFGASCPLGMICFGNQLCMWS